MSALIQCLNIHESYSLSDKGWVFNRKNQDNMNEDMVQKSKNSRDSNSMLN